MKISVDVFGHAQMGDAILERGQQQLKDVARAALLELTRTNEERRKEREGERGGERESKRGGV